MIIASTSNIELSKYAPNILPVFANFDDDFLWNEVSGGTYAVAENNGSRAYYGKKSCLITFTDIGDEYRFNSGGTQLNTTIPKTGTYKISFRLFSENASANIRFGIEVFKSVGGGSPVVVDNIYCHAHSSTGGYVNGRWNTFSADLDFDLNDVLSFNFYAESTIASATKLHFDGFKIELVDRGQTEPTFYTPATFDLIHTASVTIPTTSSHDAVRVDVNISGLLVGDTVVLNKVGDDILASTFTLQQPQVKTNGVVTFKASNIHSGTASSVTDDITFKITR